MIEHVCGMCAVLGSNLNTTKKKQREKIQPPLLIGRPDGETGTGELGAGEWGGVSLGLYHSTPEASKFKFSICSATVILIHRH